MAHRRTKIIATIGPTSDSPAVLAALVDAGMDMARVGLAHGPVEESLARIGRVRAAAESAGRHIGIFADLPGPKVRAAAFSDAGEALEAESEVRLQPSAGTTDRSAAARIAVDHPSLLEDLQAGDTVGLGDGGVTLVVEQVGADAAVARVLTGGVLRGRPGVNLPPGRMTGPVPTADDMRLLDAVAAHVDAIAVSFVRTAADVTAAKQAVGTDGPLVIAKVETPSAVDDIDGIIQASDAVMVARGDLGVRCRLEDVPHIQKRIIRTGVAWGRPVITATQMLESMVHAPTPTRAEVSDVANAVFDGTSALMLSGETAIGSDPAHVVRTMAMVARRAEEDFDYLGWGRGLGRQQTAAVAGAPANVRIVAAITGAAWRAAAEAEVAAIVCSTRSGATARAIARFRPTAPVLAVTPSPRTARQLSMAWGVQVAITEVHASTDDIIWFGVKAAHEMGLARPGDIVAVLAGSPREPETTTDVLRLVRLT